MKDESKYDQIKSEGIAQLRRYMSSDEMKRLDNLKCYLILFSKKKTGEAILVE